MLKSILIWLSRVAGFSLPSILSISGPLPGTPGENPAHSVPNAAELAFRVTVLLDSVEGHLQYGQLDAAHLDLTSASVVIDQLPDVSEYQPVRARYVTLETDWALKSDD